MTQQRNGKTGRPRRIGGKGARILRPRPPARGGGAGRSGPGQRSSFLARANAQQKNGHARSLRRARQTQARGEIERARGAENFDQRRAETLAARRFDAGAQHRFGVPAPHQRQGGGIDAEFRKSHAVQPPGLAFQEILPRPEQRTPRRGATGQSETETDGGGPIGAPGRMDLMQAGPAQPAAEKSVDAGRAQGETRGAIRRCCVVVAGLGEETPQDSHSF
jgi:hypothetical protein